MKCLLSFFIVMLLLLTLVSCQQNPSISKKENEFFNATNISKTTQSLTTATMSTISTVSTTTIDETCHHTSATTSSLTTIPSESSTPSTLTLTQIKTMVNDHSGRWYLEGYSDIFIDVSYIYDSSVTEFNESMEILAENFSFKDSEVISVGEGYGYLLDYTLYPNQYADEEKYPNGLSWCSGLTIFFDEWKASVSKEKIALNGTHIYIDKLEFIRH